MKRSILAAALIAVAGPAAAQFLNPPPSTLESIFGSPASGPISAPLATPPPYVPPPPSPLPAATGNVVTPGVRPPSLAILPN